MHIDLISILNLIIQVLLLVVVLWYTSETSKIRRASQKQVAASENQMEALHKPCLTLATTARNPEDVILKVNDLSGAMVAKQIGGDIVLQNIGTGPALNVRYEFILSGRPSIDAYIPYISCDDPIAIPLAIATLRLHTCEAMISYESVSGRRYTSTIRINNLVLTDFRLS